MLLTNSFICSCSVLNSVNLLCRSALTFFIICLNYQLTLTTASLMSIFSTSQTNPVDPCFNELSNPQRCLTDYINKNKENDLLRRCKNWEVCNKIDTYSTPWIERYCKCPNNKQCSASLSSSDGHSIIDKTRQFKICEPISKLSTCRYFRDVTWTLTSYSDNRTEQRMGCICPRNSVAYIFKHQAFQNDDDESSGHRYFFACSPESRLRCRPKEPCRLFTVMQRPEIEEVNINTLCHCQHGFTCPTNHNDASVKEGTSYLLDRIKTYTGYCSPAKVYHQKDSLGW